MLYPNSSSNSLTMSRILSNTPFESGAEDKFQSTRGNDIALGSHKRIVNRDVSAYKPTMIYHDEGPIPTSHAQPQFTGSLSETKFHKGFQRRSESNIFNEFKEAEQKYKTLSEQRSLETLVVRKDTLLRASSSVHFDIINGSKRTTGEHVERPQGLRMNGDGLSDEAPRRGNAILRESTGRYFAPYPCGVTQNYRQDVLLREGISKPKMTSLLQLGQADLKSYGVEDQFAKSTYCKRKDLIGLHELTKPGEFSPKKQPRNPSGKPEVVKNWGKGITIAM